MILNKRIFRSAREHKGIYSVIIILLALSIMLFVVFKTEMPIVKSGIESFKVDNNMEDASFETAYSISDLDELRDKYNIEIEEFKYKDFKIEGGTIRAYSFREYINKHSIIEGEDLSVNGEIVLSEALCKDKGYKIGDKIVLGNKKFIIKGTSAYPDYMYLVENEATLFTNQTSFAVGIISKEDFNEIKDYNSYYGIRFNDNNKEDVKKYINEKYGVLSWVEKEDNPKITTVNGELTGYAVLGDYIPPGIILIISVIISIVIWRQIKNDLSSLGTLYALGYKRKKIIKHYLTYPIILTLLGTIIGVVLGVMCFGTIVQLLKFEYALPLIKVSMNFKIIALSMIIPFIIIVPINYIVIRKALSHSPVKLMKGSIKEEGPTFLERKISLNRLSFKWNMRIKDTLRSPGRVLLILSSIIFSTVLLAFIFVVSDAMNDIIEKGYKEAYKGEHIYYLSNLSTDEVKGERIFTIPVSLENSKGDKYQFRLEGREEDSKLFVLKDKKGEDVSFEDNIITSNLAENLGVGVGDTVEIKSDLDGKIYNIKIEKIAESMIGDNIYIPLDRFYEITGYPKGSYMSVISEEQIDFKDGEVKSYITKGELIKGIRDLTEPLMKLMYLMGGVSVLIACALLFVVATLIVTEKSREISLYKILGYKNKRIQSIILNGNIILVVLGFFMALPLCNSFFKELFKEITKDTQFVLSGKLSFNSTCMVFLILVFAFFASLIVSKIGVNKVSMEEALKRGRE